MLAICVRFCSCLCNQVCSRVAGALLLTSRTLSLSFLTNNSSSDSKAFLHFIAFSGSPTAVHRAFLFFDAKAWLQSQTDLFTCTTVLHCGHTFLRCIALRCMHYGITLGAYLSEPLLQDSHKRLTGLSSTEKPQYCVLQVT